MDKFNIYSEKGDLVLCDSNLEYPETDDIDKDTAKRKYVFLTEEEGDYLYDIGVIVGEWDNQQLQKQYHSVGGYLGLNINSGKLNLLTKKEWKKNSIKREVSLKSGIYRAKLFNREINDYSEYREELVKKVGENDMKYYELVDKFGLFAWLPTLIFFISLFTKIGQEYWLLSFMAILVFWLPYIVLQKTKKYKEIEKTRINHESSYPYYLVQLIPQPQGEIPGGQIYLND